jgi:MFS transporter, DHA3 family, macrolide efflux protein
MLALLRNRNFLLLFLGQLCSQFGDRLTQLVLVALVATHAAGSSLSLAKVLVATSLPALLINPFAGAYVDRWDRKRIMMVCDLIRVGVIFSLPWLAASQSQMPLYGGVFLLFAVSAFFIPARLAMIPDLVSKEDLAKANALFTTSGMVGATIIVLLGALLVEWIGAVRSCWVNAISYAASAFFIAPIVRTLKRPAAKQRETAGHIFHEINEGIQELWRNHSTRRVISLLGVLMAGAGISVVVGTVMVQEALGSITKDLGFLSLWLGIGMLGGTVAYGRWGTKLSKPRIVGFSFLGCGASLALFIHTLVTLGSGVAASGTMVLLGICVSPVGIITNTLVHGAHPERLHGRIFSSLGVVVNLSLVIAMLAGGWLADHWNGVWLLWGVCLLFALTGTALLYYTLRRPIPIFYGTTVEKRSKS